MMKLFAGTSGYSYKEWKGNFYPAKISADAMLRYYAERFPSVEINNTFYRMPKTSVLESWAEQVPADFRFVIKASRRITHMKRLHDARDVICPHCSTYCTPELETLDTRQTTCPTCNRRLTLHVDGDRIHAELA